MTATLDPATLAADLGKRLKGMDPDQREGILAHARAHHVRQTTLTRYAHPAELALAVEPGYVMTPAIELLSRSVERALTEPQRNLLITMPPQEGKSDLCSVWAVIRALQHDPNTRVILATYGDSLAEDHSRKALGVIRSHGTGAFDAITGQPVEDKLGLRLDESRASVSGWKVEGGRGGLKAVGLGSAITGSAADLFIIDDPYKNMQEADSEAHRRKVDEWWKSVALTRLAPNASVILIQTRWHPEDLAGTILASEDKLDPEDRTWRYINIPAVSAVGVPDALNRPPGVAMTSARGRTAAQFEARRRAVGERVWFALYAGVPTPPEGGLFSRAWFDDHRLDAAPADPAMTVVAVDPAETGKGDEAGIIAASLAHGTVVFTHDRSGKFTSEQWAREAVLLAVEVGASEVAVEAYTAATTYRRVVLGAYQTLHKELRARDADTLTETERKIASRTTPPFTVHLWRGKGDAVARSALLRQAVEVGTARVVGDVFGVFVDQAATWQLGQHQPDRLAAGVIAHDRLTAQAGRGESVLASPTRTTGRGALAPGWSTRRAG